MPKNYLTEVQVSDLTGRKPATLRNDRHYKQGIPYIKAGRSVRYDYDEVIAWMEARRVRTTD
jgi:predicted DNA-binding transcriptional regulator AlpA